MRDPGRGPLEQLVRSHRRLEERLADLVELAHRGELDAEALEGILGFLTHQVARHEQDEEQSLFPRLAREPALEDVVRQLTAEHQAHRALHDRLAEVARRASAGPAPEDRAELVRVANALEDAYRAHIDVEEAVLFPGARKALDALDLAAMHEEMQARRGAAGRRGDRR